MGIGTVMVSSRPLFCELLTPAVQLLSAEAVPETRAAQPPGSGVDVIEPVASGGVRIWKDPPEPPLASAASKKLKDTNCPAAPGGTRIRLNVEEEPSALM